MVRLLSPFFVLALSIAMCANTASYGMGEKPDRDEPKLIGDQKKLLLHQEELKLCKQDQKIVFLVGDITVRPLAAAVYSYEPLEETGNVCSAHTKVKTLTLRAPKIDASTPETVRRYAVWWRDKKIPGWISLYPQGQLIKNQPNEKANLDAFFDDLVFAQKEIGPIHYVPPAADPNVLTPKGATASIFKVEFRLYYVLLQGGTYEAALSCYDDHLFGCTVREPFIGMDVAANIHVKSGISAPENAPSERIVFPRKDIFLSRQAALEYVSSLTKE